MISKRFMLVIFVIISLAFWRITIINNESINGLIKERQAALNISGSAISPSAKEKEKSDREITKEAAAVSTLRHSTKKINQKTTPLPEKLKYILLWTSQTHYTAPFTYFGNGQRGFKGKKCPVNNCFVTFDKNFFAGDVTQFDAIGFNGPTLLKNTSDIPNSRSIHQKYIYFNLESADNFPFCGSEFDNFFNWTATYRLDSDLPFPYIQIKDQFDEIIGPKSDMKWPDSINELDYDCRQNKTKAVAWFVSHCRSRSGREKYVIQLQEALEPFEWTLDIYGACGPLDCERYTQTCASMLDTDYFFYLSFENSFSEDYVTEKLLTALQNNVVPIVFGGADYNRFLPPGSYIDARKTTPQELAVTIDRIIHSSSLYNSFFKWKSYYKYADASRTDSVCEMCAALNNEELMETYTSYGDFRSWWHPNYRERCDE